MSLTPKNWDSFQHYKDRAPAWIKLHRGLLDDFTFSRLPVASRALAPLLWLLASEYEGGKITATVEELAFRLRMSHDEMILALTPLIESGFFNASEPLAERKQEATPEREGEKQEKKEEKLRAVAKTTRPNADFEAFWEARPKRKGADPKDPARKLYEAVVKAGAVPAELLAALRRYAAIEAEHVGTPYLPQMVKWLRDKRWADYPEVSIQAPNEQTDWDAICSLFKKVGHWSRHGGNHPDSGSCRCPPEILAKHGIVSATGHDPPPAPVLRTMQ